MSYTAESLRGMDLAELVGVMQSLGLPTEELTEKNAALTYLFHSAISAE